MLTHGKSINLFLMDGSPTGRVKCTLANWTGVAYKIPRTDLEKCKERTDLLQSGVYFLFGTSDETNESIAYIGQAGVRKNGEALLCRLQEHQRDPNKDYWTEVVLFTTSNNSFGPTEISYLENRFCVLAQAANRYKIKNGNEPNMGNITEEKSSELEEFIDYAIIVMGVLGHNLFEPLRTERVTSQMPNQIENDDLLLQLRRKSMKSQQVIQADCKRTREGFVVLKGSQIEVIDSETLPASVKKMRDDSQIDKNGVLQHDVLLRSPSYAASFVIGMTTNGLTAWKTLGGRTLKEVIENGD